MAENKNENQQSQEMLDKTYVVEGFDPSKLQNADVNLSQYWDDSSEANYNNPSLWGGENTKYTGENTLGSQVAYNPNATVEGLDPNYLYWQEAQMQNSKETNYIAKRNDEIASALYNAWKTSIQDVNDFLDSQRGFYNSVWNERANTITAVWKRIGQIAKQNENSDGQPTDPNKTPDEWNNDALNNMQSDLNKSTAWELYGKVTADQDTHIKTLEDENSVYKLMNESRINAFKSLQSMSDEWLATAIIWWEMSGDSQAMRDLMQYDPAKYERVKLAEKQIRGQMTINSITSGEGDYVTTATNGKSWLNNEIADFISSNGNVTTSAAELLNSVNTTLSSNQSFNSANETMDALENDMATLQNRLKNLKREASTVFKWDVPQYIVNAYVANRTQEIQDQLSILENRYNAAQSRADKEWSRTMEIMNYNLKLDELNLKREAQGWSKFMDQQWLLVDIAKLTWDYSSLMGTSVDGNDIQVSSLSQEQIGSVVDSLVLACQNWQLGNAQCAAWIQKNFFPLIGVDLWRLSSWEQKKAICTNLAWEYNPVKGDVIVMSSKSKPENWHMWIVVGYKWGDPNKLIYLDWNWELGADWKWTEEPWLHEISLNNSRIYGYYVPTSWAATMQQQSKWTTRFGKEYDFWLYSGWNRLSEEEKSLVKWILEYRVDPTTLAKSWAEWAKSNTRIRAAAVAIWGQDFDYQEDEYKRRYELVKKWNNATQAGWELSRNATAADELMRLYNIYHKYEKTHGGVVPLNWWASNISRLEGFPQVEEFNAALQVAASELAWALKGNASPSKEELQEYKDALKYYLSPAQFDAKISEYLHGINNKMASEAQYYEKITGRKPQNIYNQYEWLPQFVSDVAWIDLSNYFSDVNATAWTTKRETKQTTSWPNTNRGNNQSSSWMTPEEKAAATMGA